jgi:hypothetical protein
MRFCAGYQQQQKDSDAYQQEHLKYDATVHMCRINVRYAVLIYGLYYWTAVV